MTSPFIPMDTPNQQPAAGAAPDLPHVCSPVDGRPAEEVDPAHATAANLRAGLASRLRSAYEQGVPLEELAAACHQPVAEVRELLRQAGADPNAPLEVAGDREAGVVPQQRDGRGESLSDPETWIGSAPRPRPRVRRPAPIRRAPRFTSARGGEATGGRPYQDDPQGWALTPGGEPGLGGFSEDGTRDAAESETLTAASLPQQPAEGPDGLPVDGSGDDTALGDDQPAGGEPQLGILIGGSGRSAEPPTRTSNQRRRVRAEVIRAGRGTTLTLLPSWRSSITLSVPTESLLSATGLSYQELPGAELSVEINPNALHDRELRPTGWQVGPLQERSRRQRD